MGDGQVSAGNSETPGLDCIGEVDAEEGTAPRELQVSREESCRRADQCRPRHSGVGERPEPRNPAMALRPPVSVFRVDPPGVGLRADGRVRRGASAPLLPDTDHCLTSERARSDVVGKHWNKKKTLKQNFSTLGLVNDPNEMSRSKRGDEALARAEKETAVASGVVRELEEIVASNVPTTRFAPAGEIAIVQKLVAKYGDDYTAMARDHKLNVYQHTAKQLKHKVSKVAATLTLVEKHDIVSKVDATATDP